MPCIWVCGFNANELVLPEKRAELHELKLRQLGVCDTANFGINPIQSKYRANITDTDTCHLKTKIFVCMYCFFLFVLCIL